jgi:hypothetical protein
VVPDDLLEERPAGGGTVEDPSAAIFRPNRSLNPYIQFVGRALRVNRQNAPGHVDNRGIIVSHDGLNLDRHWNDFKTIDAEDQQLVQD